LLFRWPQLFTWTSSNRGSLNVEKSEAPCALTPHKPYHTRTGVRTKYRATQGPANGPNTRRCRVRHRKATYENRTSAVRRRNAVAPRNTVTPHAKHRLKKKKHTHTHTHFSLAFNWPAAPCESLWSWAVIIMFFCVIASERIPVSKFKCENPKSVRRTTHEPNTAPNTAPSAVRAPYQTTHRAQYGHRTNTARDVRPPFLRFMFLNILFVGTVQ
jgi:hypothetical protein